ncbi:hypothetical protein UFOVP386_5 [uncultured Caudovirales phage]|uniref:Uncharacterized protein n=1 Tax=uncultured Caudovirales phage TaxID=2100421 RepID=A0A6J7X086_9CAUD|nr:hypothetical protein UFOVP386_5 [uncultured Caudovirales phage]
MASRKRIKEEYHTRYEILNHDDNSKIITYHGNNHVKITFILPGDSKEKLIGVIDKNKKILDIRRNRDKHLFQKKMAYGFNYYILKNAKLFDMIHLKDDKDEWMIPVQFILDNGTFMHFKNNGNFELQKFVSLIDLTPFEMDSRL